MSKLECYKVINLEC